MSEASNSVFGHNGQMRNQLLRVISALADVLLSHPASRSRSKPGSLLRLMSSTRTTSGMETEHIANAAATAPFSKDGQSLRNSNSTACSIVRHCASASCVKTIAAPPASRCASNPLIQAVVLPTPDSPTTNAACAAKVFCID